MMRSLACVVLLTSSCMAGLVKPRPGIPPSNVFLMPEIPVCNANTDEPVEVGTLENAALTEISGLARSPTHKNVLWGHNDSGDSARVFAISSTGKDLGVLTLPNITAVDFEDIAAAPCPDLNGPCIYVGDTGDNNLSRTSMAVYAFPEPATVDENHPLPANSEPSIVWRFPIASPVGPIDIEAMVVLPDASAMVFIEKASSGARVLKYASPWSPEGLATLEVTTTFDPPAAALERDQLPTAADVHPSGTRMLLRTYGAVFELKLDNGVTADHFAASDLTKLFDGPASEPQGESIAYDVDGTGFFTVSESPQPNQPLHHASCSQ